MNDEAKPAPETEADKKPSFLSKLAAHRSYILHSLLVFLLFGFFVWQILSFYQLSTDYNRARAVKTHHMVVFDIETGKFLSNLPEDGVDAKEDTAGTHQSATDETPDAAEVQAEVAVVITGLGKDATYTSEVTTLPPEFVFSYSPYGIKPLETSKYKAAEGATVIAETQYADGKFDISGKNNDFRNLKNVEAALSKIFGASVIYVSAPENYISSKAFTELATRLEEKQTLVLLPNTYKGSLSNVVSADVFIKAVTSPAEIKQQLTRLEVTAQSEGYAIAVIEPQPGVGAVLKEWAAGLDAKKIKLTPVIKN